jgi:O-succinylbenzoic acid--CoA ligase
VVEEPPTQHSACETPAQWLRGAAAQSSHNLALRIEDVTHDYAGLLGRAERLAVGLEACGVGAGSLLAVTVESAPLIAHLVHATALIGAALLPLNPALTEAAMAELLERCGATHLIDADIAGESATGIRRIDPGPLLRLLATQAVATPRGSPGSLDDIHLVLATSGTTGIPKGVMLSGRNLSAAVAAAVQRLPLTADDLWLDCLPLFHIGGLSILYRCLRQRASVLLHSGFDVGQLVHDLRRYPVTHLSLVPAMLARLLGHWQGLPPASLRFVLIGGGPLSGELARRAWEGGWPICPSYGMSETGSQLATYSGPPERWREGQAGHPLAGFEVEVSGEKKSGGRIGRIRVRGNAVMSGYANAQRQSGDGLDGGWFETGDVGLIEEDGTLSVIGRADDMLISGGENVHPAEVERRMGECPGIQEVAVTARPDPVWGDSLVALVVGTIGPDDLDQWCRRHLRGAWRPREFLIVGSLPHNAMGKLDRRALRKIVSERPPN